MKKSTYSPLAIEIIELEIEEPILSDSGTKQSNIEPTTTGTEMTL